MYVPPLDYRMNAAISIGDYKTVINIVTAKLEKNKAPVHEKMFLLSYLARAYFELGDFEKLKIIVQKYDELKKTNPKSNKFITPNSMWFYYSFYLVNNFEYCKSLSATKKASVNPKSRYAESAKIHNDFYYAIACYANGDREVAQNVFEDIIVAAPKLHIAEISREYVEAIKNNSELAKKSEILPDPDFNIAKEPVEKRGLSQKWAAKIFLGIMLCGFLTYFVLTLVENKQDNEQFDFKNVDEYVVFSGNIDKFTKKFSNALERSYEGAKVVKSFEVEKDGELIDVFCIVEYKGRFDLISFVSYEKIKGRVEDTFVPLMTGINVPGTYFYLNENLGYQIQFEFTNKEIGGTDYEDVIEFTHKGVDYWFGIDYIRLTKGRKPTEI